MQWFWIKKYSIVIFELEFALPMQERFVLRLVEIGSVVQETAGNLQMTCILANFLIPSLGMEGGGSFDLT